MLNIVLVEPEIAKGIVAGDGAKVFEYKGVRYNVKNVFIADDQSVELTVGKY